MTPRPCSGNCWPSLPSRSAVARVPRFFGQQTKGWARDDAGIALPIELLPHLVRQIGFEPMTDNPMSSAHRNWSGSRDLHPDRLLHRERCCLLHHNPVLHSEYAMQSATFHEAVHSVLCIHHSALELGPLVGLAPTNTSLRNSPCSC